MEGIPQNPERVLLRHESRTNLGVGQTGYMVYPISKCCGQRADRRREMPWGSTVYEDDWYCCHCGDRLEEFDNDKHYESFDLAEGEVESTTRLFLTDAVVWWTGIPQDEMTLEIT